MHSLALTHAHEPVKPDKKSPPAAASAHTHIIIVRLNFCAFFLMYAYTYTSSKVNNFQRVAYTL